MKEEEPKAPTETPTEDKRFPSKDLLFRLILNLLVYPLGVMLLWNCNMTEIFALPEISFIQAMGLYCLSNLLLVK